MSPSSNLAVPLSSFSPSLRSSPARFSKSPASSDKMPCGCCATSWYQTALTDYAWPLLLALVTSLAGLYRRLVARQARAPVAAHPAVKVKTS